MKYRIITIFILAGLFLSSASAADYYVSSTGSDSNSGTNSVVPWKTIAKVNAMMSTFSTKALAGNVTIYFNNADTWNFANSDVFNITCTGAPLLWITFDGTSWGTGTTNVSKAKFIRTESTIKPMVHVKYGDGSYAQDAYVKFKGFELDGDEINDGILFWVDNASYVTLMNCKIHDCVGGWTPGVLFTTTDTAGTIEIDHLVVTGNEIYGAGVHGLAFYPSHGGSYGDTDDVGDVIVQNNKIHKFGQDGGTIFGGGIQVMSCVGGDISSNVIYAGSGASDGFGIKLETRNRRCDGVDIHGNLIYGGSGIELCVGICIDGAQNIDVFNNVIRDTSSEAISWGGGYGGASGRVLNNTIYKSGVDAIYLGSTSQIDELRNNIIYQTANVRAINRSDRISQHSHNNFYNTTSGRAVVGSFTTGNWVSGWEQTGKNVSPGFENVNALPTSFDVIGKMIPTGLRITSTGSAYQGGTDLTSVFNDDIDGNTRTAPWDIGACQFTASGGETQIPAPPSRPRVILDI